jgi:hypothetical protein
MNKSFYFILVFFLSILIPVKSFAWGNKGHAIVSEVAFNYLDANTKKIVLQYLDGMTIEEASNWMDNIRDDHSYDYMKPYHYVNFEKGEEVYNKSGNNIISILTSTIEELKNHKNLPKEEVKIKICILFHLIGDLHQPLHVGYGEDKGGNMFQINFNNKGTNLHSFYDSGIIVYKGLTFQECLSSNKLSKEEIENIKKGNILNWATESRTYLDTIYNTNGHKVNEDYVNANYIIIKNQLFKAGISLSTLLNQIFI